MTQNSAAVIGDFVETVNGSDSGWSDKSLRKLTEWGINPQEDPWQDFLQVTAKPGFRYLLFGQVARETGAHRIVISGQSP